MKQIAEVVYEVNRAYCRALGDDTRPPWVDVSDEVRNSIISGILFCVKNPDVDPEILHEKWCSDKLAEGWRYGPKRDEKAKTHPCLVPYRELSTLDKVKDYLFQAVVQTLL